MVLAPLFVVVAVRSWHPASPAMWTAIAFAYLGASLIWSPAESLPGAIEDWLGGHSENLHGAYRVAAMTALAQFLIIFVAARGARAPAVDEPAARPTRS